MAGADYFLKIDGIPGESTDSKHKAEIVLTSFSMGLSNSGSLASGTGGGEGKASFHDFHFTAQFSKASPLLMAACATGKHIPSAVLTARKAGGRGGGFEFLFVKMNDVLVSSVESAESGNVVPNDAVSLAFAKVEVDYKEQKATGALGATTSFRWNLLENRQG
jgi:type VI secretion system secreted protein Hcp